MSQRLKSILTYINFSNVGVSAAIAAALVIAPLLAFSETTLKSIMDRWLSQCTVVIDITQDGKEAPIVRLYSFGDMPESLPLTFATNKGLIERVSLLNHVEQDTVSSEPNILVHPLANQRCPGDLCADTSDASEKLTVRIKPVTSNYVYQFRVIFKASQADSKLKAYVKPLLDEKIACRVETTTLSNFLARQSRGIQVLIFFLAIVIFTSLLRFLHSRIGA